MDYIGSIKISNSHQVELRFDLEPWGEQYRLPPGEVVVVIAKSSLPGAFEIDISKDVVTVFGWVGSTVQVFQGGKEIGGSSQRSIVPPVP